MNYVSNTQYLTYKFVLLCELMMSKKPIYSYTLL